MFESIVVAYDGSANADRALEAGSRLAATEQARLGIVYVIDLDRMSLSPEIRKMGEVEHIIEPTGFDMHTPGHLGLTETPTHRPVHPG